jgi:hydroxypyruvate isomerase
MTRRTVFQLAGAAAALPSLSAQPAPLKGRLKQSAARWCYSKIGLDDLAREAARIGLKGIDLIDYKEWPTVQKYGLVPAMTPGAGGIADGFNRKENHDKLVREMEENIPRAAAAKVPNVITFSGNRRGQADAEGLDNCTIGLNRVKKLAEDKGVTVCVELLNSKIDHHDYQCDHTAWGV